MDIGEEYYRKPLRPRFRHILSTNSALFHFSFSWILHKDNISLFYISRICPHIYSCTTIKIYKCMHSLCLSLYFSRVRHFSSDDIIVSKLSWAFKYMPQIFDV